MCEPSCESKKELNQGESYPPNVARKIGAMEVWNLGTGRNLTRKLGSMADTAPSAQVLAKEVSTQPGDIWVSSPGLPAAHRKAESICPVHKCVHWKKSSAER